MLNLPTYSSRKALPEYSSAWLDTEHQNIQRALSVTRRVTRYHSQVDGGLTTDSVFDDRAKLDTLVNTTMQPGGGQLDIVGVPRLASNVTIPANVLLNFVVGAYLAPDVGVTVTINGSFDQSLEKKFGGGGTFILAGKKTPNIYAEWWGAKGDGAALDAVPCQAALTSTIASQATYRMAANATYVLEARLVAQNAVKCRMKGAGWSSIFSMPAANNAYAIQLAGVCDRVTFSTFRITGLGTVDSGQNGIVSNQTATNLTFDRVEIDNTCVGIALIGTFGALSNAWVLNCYIHDIKGGAAGGGAGYGLHVADAYNVTARGNHFDNCSRHALYQAISDPTLDCGNIYAGNRFTNHRKDVFDGTLRCAMVISRSHGVGAYGNTFKDGYDGAMEISPDNEQGKSCSNVQVVSNRFRGRKNAVPYVLMGQGVVPTGTNRLTDVLFEANFLHSDEAVNKGPMVTLWNGVGIDFIGNRFRMVNVNDAAARKAVFIGDQVNSPNLVDLDDILAQGNSFTFTGTTLTDTRAFTLDGAACTTQSNVEIAGSKMRGVTSGVIYILARTNTALRWAGNGMPDTSGVYGAMTYDGPIGKTNGAGIPPAGLGINGDLAYRQDGAAGTRQYRKEGGVWVGIL